MESSWKVPCSFMTGTVFDAISCRIHSSACKLKPFKIPPPMWAEELGRPFLLQKEKFSCNFWWPGEVEEILEKTYRNSPSVTSCLEVEWKCEQKEILQTPEKLYIKMDIHTCPLAILSLKKCTHDHFFVKKENISPLK